MNRIQSIDLSKGIGMLLVILGHCAFFGGQIHNLIFAFHMPLFFILSGMVFKPRKGEKNIAFRKAKVLLVPYLVFCGIGIVASILIPAWRHELSMKGIIYDIYLGNPENIHVSSIWFLVCMYWVVMIAHYIFKIENANIRVIIVLIIAGIGFGFAEYNSYFGFLLDGRLPFCIDVAFVATLFFFIGRLMKGLIKYEEEMDVRMFIILGGSVLLFTIAYMSNGRTNLHALTFNNIFLYLVESITGSITIIILCKVIDNKWGKLRIIRGIRWIGRYSLIILGTQSILVRLYIVFLNSLGHNFSLYQLPLIHQIVSFIFVTILSILCTYIFLLVKARIKGEIHE